MQQRQAYKGTGKKQPQSSFSDSNLPKLLKLLKNVSPKVFGIH
jgi:hypothetical protein